MAHRDRSATRPDTVAGYATVQRDISWPPGTSISLSVPLLQTLPPSRESRSDPSRSDAPSRAMPSTTHRLVELGLSLQRLGSRQYDVAREALISTSPNEDHRSTTTSEQSAPPAVLDSTISGDATHGGLPSATRSGAGQAGQRAHRGLLRLRESLPSP